MPFEIVFTPTPVTLDSTMSELVQEIDAAIDVSCFDQLDLVLELAATDANGLLVEVLTGMSNRTSEGWIPAATFRVPSGVSSAVLARTVSNPLRYVRFRCTAINQSTASVWLEGMARRRRYSRFTPASLADLRWWLKADAIVDAENNTPLSLWVDSGPLGNDFTQSTSTSRPLFQRGALNGLPSVKFDGVDDFMESRYGDELGDFTVAVVYRRYGGGTVSYERVIDKNYVDGFWIGRDDVTASQWGGGVREASPPYGGFGTFTDGVANLMIFRRSGTTLEIYNGRNLVKTVAAGAGTTDNALYRLAVAFYFGLYAYSPIEIFEAATYGAALSSDAMGRLCEYVREKWRVG